ncbi:hypothetical protein MBLNU457_3568t1 [Dothideomycetes sp. NU457]
MATEAPVNGTYASHGSFDQSAGYNNSTSSGQPSYSNGASNQAPSSGASQEIPKDEVGWYFVEQYYTTLSRSPEKLYLFYNKRSQFVLGNEADKVAVCVGQKAINEHIKDLDFRDCKVRVTNVDSQASDANIVIQVIGEISNKSQPHKKFTQTFVLAGQTNGYFVLNDIFRYIIEEEDAAQNDDDQAQSTEAAAGLLEPTSTAVEQPAAETLSSSQDPAAIEQSASQVDKELQQKVLDPSPIKKEDPPTGAVNGTSAPAEDEMVQASDAPVAATTAADEPAQSTIQDVESQTIEEPETEKPKDPEPTPAISPAKSAAQPASASPAQASAPAPSKPSAPKSWASLAAAAHRTPPAVPVPQQSSSAAAPQTKAAPVPAAAPAPAAAPSPAPAPSAAAAPAEASPAKQEDEWTAVGDHKKQQKGAQAAAGAQEGPQTRAYIKNVSENLDPKDLRAAMEKFGDITYFDVHKAKNCAFVDFKTPEAYKAAVDANPHQVGTDRVVVEERRTKPGMPFAPRGGARGGGRGGQAQGGRGNFQGGRGGFAGRGRGGANAPRGGRGGATPAAQ